MNWKKFAVPICFRFSVADPFEIGCEVSANLSMSLFLHSDAGPKFCCGASSFYSRQVINNWMLVSALWNSFACVCAQYDRPFFL